MNSWGRRRQRRPARSCSMGPVLASRRLGAGVDVIRVLSDSAGDSLFDHCGRDRAVVQTQLTRVRTRPIFEHGLGAGGAGPPSSPAWFLRTMRSWERTADSVTMN